MAQTNSELINKIWCKVKAERKDGSRIIDHQDTENAFYMFVFTQDSFRFISNGYQNFKSNGKYLLQNNRLIINNISYSIDHLNQQKLIYTEEFPDLSDDEINRYYFVSAEFYLDSLIKNKLITLENDTIIASYKYFPFLKNGDISQFILDKMPNSVMEGKVVGSFIISPINHLENIVIKDKFGFNDKHLVKIKKALKESSGYWIIPGLNNYFLKTNFILTLSTIKDSGRRISNEFVVDGRERKEDHFSAQDLSISQNFFNKGMLQTKKNKFSKAIESFTKCIEIDSINLNAFYNRAYIYMTMDSIKKACSDWYYLSKLDQKKAKEYYQQYCNK